MGRHKGTWCASAEHSLACLLQCLCPLNQWVSFFGLLVLSAVASELVGMITLTKIRYPDKSSVFSRWFLSLWFFFSPTTSHIIKKWVFHCYFIYNRLEDLFSTLRTFYIWRYDYDFTILLYFSFWIYCLRLSSLPYTLRIDSSFYPQKA